VTIVRRNKEVRVKKTLDSRRSDSTLQPGARKERAVENQPFSPNSVGKAPRIRGAHVTESVCPYCAVGCGQLVYTKAGKVIDIEGNPASPINQGTQCPKGANTFQLTVNPHRIKHVLYRAPYSETWEQRPLDWAMERIAQKLKDARDADYIESRDGTTLNHLTTVASLGGATMDNEENYLIKKLFGGGLGVVAIENQARI
jgi:formate dehydrogenase major subunit